MEAATLQTELAVVLTCSVTPRPFAGTRPVNAEERAEDYRRCLNYYLHNDPVIKKFVLLDNTHYPLDKIVEPVAASAGPDVQIEALSVGSNDFDLSLGKGYGEFLMLRDGVLRSKLLSGCTHFVKMTGRTLLRNLTPMVRSMPTDAALYCDIRDHNLGRFYKPLGRSQFADSRFFGVSRSFFDSHMLNLFEQMNDSSGQFAENVMYHLAMRHREQRDVYLRFKREPHYAGLAGYVGGDYDNLKSRLKRSLRAVSRVALPSLKI